MNNFDMSVERLVVKVGTGYIFDLTDSGYHLNEGQMNALTEEAAAISDDRELMLVSSGAVTAAAWKLGMKELPDDPYAQAQLAGEGQPCLMAEYQKRFESYGKRSAQCLLCSDDLDIRKMKRHLRKNQEGYLRDGIITVYNENDFISIDEITFGDNDILAGLLTKEMDADMMVVMSYPTPGLGRGGGKSKEATRSMLEGEDIPMEIINERYEKVDGIYRPKIGELL